MAAPEIAGDAMWRHLFDFSRVADYLTSVHDATLRSLDMNRDGFFQQRISKIREIGMKLNNNSKLLNDCGDNDQEKRNILLKAREEMQEIYMHLINDECGGILLDYHAMYDASTLIEQKKNIELIHSLITQQVIFNHNTCELNNAASLLSTLEEPSAKVEQILVQMSTLHQQSINDSTARQVSHNIANKRIDSIKLINKRREERGLKQITCQEHDLPCQLMKGEDNESYFIAKCRRRCIVINASMASKLKESCLSSLTSIKIGEETHVAAKLSAHFYDANYNSWIHRCLAYNERWNISEKLSPQQARVLQAFDAHCECKHCFHNGISQGEYATDLNDFKSFLFSVSVSVKSDLSNSIVCVSHKQTIDDYVDQMILSFSSLLSCIMCHFHFAMLARCRYWQKQSKLFEYPFMTLYSRHRQPSSPSVSSKKIQEATLDEYFTNFLSQIAVMSSLSTEKTSNQKVIPSKRSGATRIIPTGSKSIDNENDSINDSIIPSVEFTSSSSLLPLRKPLIESNTLATITRKCLELFLHHPFIQDDIKELIKLSSGDGLHIINEESLGKLMRKISILSSNVIARSACLLITNKKNDTVKGNAASISSATSSDNSEEGNDIFFDVPNIRLSDLHVDLNNGAMKGSSALDYISCYGNMLFPSFPNSAAKHETFLFETKNQVNANQSSKVKQVHEVRSTMRMFGFSSSDPNSIFPVIIAMAVAIRSNFEIPLKDRNDIPDERMKYYSDAYKNMSPKSREKSFFYKMFRELYEKAWNICNKALARVKISDQENDQDKSFYTGDEYENRILKIPSIEQMAENEIKSLPRMRPVLKKAMDQSPMLFQKYQRIEYLLSRFRNEYFGLREVLDHLVPGGSRDDYFTKYISPNAQIKAFESYLESISVLSYHIDSYQSITSYIWPIPAEYTMIDKLTGKLNAEKNIVSWLCEQWWQWSIDNGRISQFVEETLSTEFIMTGYSHGDNAFSTASYIEKESSMRRSMIDSFKIEYSKFLSLLRNVGDNEKMKCSALQSRWKMPANWMSTFYIFLQQRIVPEVLALNDQ